MTGSARKTGTWLPLLCVATLLAACDDEPAPTPVSEFVDDPILLEATMVRCMENRAEARYDPECINARDAVDSIAAAREKERRAELEAQSERKRQALRRAQQAAAEARRRTQDEQRRRDEAEYLGQFEPLPDGDGETVPPAGAAAPETALPPPPGRTAEAPEGSGPGAAGPPAAERAAPHAVPAPAGDESPDLETLRLELQQRLIAPEAHSEEAEPDAEQEKPELR